MKAVYLLVFILGCVAEFAQGVRQHRRYGDMLLSQRQEEAILHPNINERKAIKDIVRRWTNNVVPYKYAANATQNRKTIEQGLNLWRENTCLEIVEDKAGKYVAKKDSHILIGNADTGCFSHVGMIESEKPQELNLGDGCVLVDTVAHEFGHSLGLFHEQERPDRDKYVTINKNNVDKENHDQFNLEIHSDTFGTPYDYKSIMHYAAFDFSNNDQIVIAPKDVWMEPLIGTVPTPSYNDYLIVNKMYNCIGSCAQNFCGANGYPFTKAKKCKCICKDGYSGAKCEKKNPVKANPCPNKEIKKSGEYILSPGYPNTLPKKVDCNWLITAPKGKKIQLDPEVFHMQAKGQKSGKCVLGYFRVRYGDLQKGGTTELFCEKMLKKQTFNSNTAFIVLHSETINTFPGFKIKVNFV